LTFFYRQYPELLKREIDGQTVHHLFIAQPPLFKVKKGKTERYLKNEQALEDFLLENATEDVRFASKRSTLEGDQLRALAKKALRYSHVLAAIEKKADERIVDALVKASGLTKNDLKDDKATAKAAQRMGEHFKLFVPDLADATHSLHRDTEHGGWKIVWPTRFGGARKNTIIDFAFLDSPEYEELARLGADFQQFEPPYALESLDGKDGTRIALERIDKLGAQLDALGRKGLSISRYKGLGEMNAEQLWETTMDPQQRTLLEVHADDLNAAEEIFSKLMGEEVEPRREFIEQNALNVRNLDI
jgi:DNA gyrase subunit B